MSDATPSVPPPLPAPPPPPSRSRAILAGFSIGAVLSLLPLAFKGYAQIPTLAFDAFIMPIVAVVLAFNPRNRPFGLGLLLACGLGWLVLLCICGGAFRR